jgi:uncharacterized protein YjbJ (UPF0337 family)
MKGGLPGTRTLTLIATTQGVDMGMSDKAANKLDELKGKAKEKYGDLTDDRDLEAEGKVDKATANLKQAGEKVKDAFRK